MCHPRRAPQYTDDFIFWHRVELGLDRFLSSILASTALDTLWSSGVEWGFGFSAHVTFRDLVFVDGGARKLFRLRLPKTGHQFEE